MKLACMAVCYKEERFIPKYIQAMQNRVEEILVLNSSKPWNGEPVEDHTGDIAESLGATVIRYDWPTEHEQRNAGLDYLSDYDWVIVLDPDEYISDEDWQRLLETLQKPETPAYIVQHQRVFWKHEEVYPHTDYQQIIAVRPQVRFIDNRVINSPYAVAPVDLLHFSWARTNEEILNKITHYAHANQFDGKKWYQEVWLADKKTDLHPNTPETLKALIPAVLPLEIQKLDLWP